MNARDPKLTVLLFNERINARDVEGLAALMTDDHTFADRENRVFSGRDAMTRGWARFFEELPDYRNVFDRLVSLGEVVVVTGHATWSKGGPPDPALWVAKIRGDRIAEWRILADTGENRALLGLTPEEP